LFCFVLFRPSDINKPKAEVAAAFINKRVPGANVVPHYCKIQDKDDDFYSQFNLVIAGLDSIEARRWINTTLVNLVEVDEETGEIDPDTVIPLIDGGTEGFKGQARVILPRLTSCFECSLEMFPTDPFNFPMCTLQHTPRQPEHCVEYVVSKMWSETFPNTKLDKDNPEHLQWIYERSLERAKQFGIQGVTYRLVQGNYSTELSDSLFLHHLV
jgi:ubiquitin-activating enzyme E1 C